MPFEIITVIGRSGTRKMLSIRTRVEKEEVVALGGGEGDHKSLAHQFRGAIKFVFFLIWCHTKKVSHIKH